MVIWVSSFGFDQTWFGILSRKNWSLVFVCLVYIVDCVVQCDEIIVNFCFAYV